MLRLVCYWQLSEDFWHTKTFVLFFFIPGKSDLDQLHQIILLMGALPDYQIEHMEKNRKYLNLKVSFYSGSIGIFRDFFFKISKRFNKS